MQQGKNILIFSDGTGQAGGLLPDETRSNIYKLYRATRCGPDSRIDPTQQVAFYDPGLGSHTDGEALKLTTSRKIRNMLSQATGLGITENIIDCYAAVISLWRPGDRIYLFGFSRGAYTIRCVAGVIALCGIPRRRPDGTAIRYDPKSVRTLAEEAVKQVYQLGASIRGDPLKIYATREFNGSGPIMDVTTTAMPMCTPTLWEFSTRLRRSALPAVSDGL